MVSDILHVFFAYDALSKIVVVDDARIGIGEEDSGRCEVAFAASFVNNDFGIRFIGISRCLGVDCLEYNLLLLATLLPLFLPMMLTDLIPHTFPDRFQYF